MARPKGENKQQRLAREVADEVGSGVPWHLEIVDFNSPNRPKTCLEVDFPIVPINRTSSIEASSGAATKPIYRLSKWWARRQSSVFRALAIAAATKAPDEPAEVAKLVWDAYYGNHQDNEGFQKLKVADIFMGGGTTIVEGARLGMQMYGNDLNPVAWFVVKNELAQVDRKEVQRLLDRIETEVKPQIMPFYACDCPRGHKGKWRHKATSKLLGPSFDPLALKPEERPQYEYSGPEVIYTFWAKHGPCQASGCQHRTPIMPSVVIAEKTISVKAWKGVTCSECGTTFDVETTSARMAPKSQFVISPEESPFAVRDENGGFTCPNCGHTSRNLLTGKLSNKPVQLAVIVDPEWLKGIKGVADDGEELGGGARDSAERTSQWNEARLAGLSLIEIRGPLSDSVEMEGRTDRVRLGSDGGTVPKQSAFACSECGRTQDILDSVSQRGKPPQFAVYAMQGYCPTCEEAGEPFDGRFYFVPDNAKVLNAACAEWSHRSNSDLKDYWPRTAVPEGFKTSYQRIPQHGYPYFADMHNYRQLLVHSQLLRCIDESSGRDFDSRTVEYVLAAFQQYLRYNSGLSFWHQANNQISAFLSNNNYPLKNTTVESSVFSPVGDGSWRSVCRSISESLDWAENPWEIVSQEEIEARNPKLGSEIKSKSIKVYPKDPFFTLPKLDCCSATNLEYLDSDSIDIVLTDPPFGNNVQYAELADFFYSWMRLILKHQYDQFVPDYTPKSLEAVVNPVRHPEDADEFYKRVLTDSWRGAYRVLKPAGILVFTFHHSEDEPWIAVLDSLFSSGFYLEATYPIRSDGTRGEGGKPGTFGSQLIEYDIIHVCRKRMDDSQPISWARMRRMILQDVRLLKQLLEQHHEAGLQEADLQVIRRGKALEYYSRHYGKVYVERGREFPVKDALLAINQMLEEEADATTEAPPAHAEAYTRQFFRLFADREDLPRDQMQKHLRGTGVSPQEFVDRGWCEEKHKVFYPLSPLVWANTWKGVSRSAMSRDFDQAMFMVGACYEGSGIKVSDTLNNPRFEPHPATGDLIDWLVRHGGNARIKAAAYTARQLFQTWLSKRENQEKLRQQQMQFGFDEAGE